MKNTMKKNYEAPIFLMTAESNKDIITTSAGDTPDVDLFGAGYEW